MAYIAAKQQSTLTTASASFSPVLPAHTEGALLLVYLSQDGGGTTIATSTTGWAMIGTQAAVLSVRGAWAYKIATSSSESDPTFTGANDEWAALALTIKDAHPTAPFGSLVSGTDYLRTDISVAGNPWTPGVMTTAVDECLLLWGYTSDGYNANFYIRPDEAMVLDRFSSTTIDNVVACYQQQSAGDSPQPRLFSIINDGGNIWTLAVRNKTNGVLQPAIRPEYEVVKYYGDFGEDHDSTTVWEAPTVFASSINSIPCHSTIATVTVVSSATGSWGAFTAISANFNMAGVSSWVGAYHSIDATDFTGKIFSVAYQYIDSIALGDGGVLIGFTDGTNWATFQAWGKGQTIPVNFPTHFIDCDNATPYAVSGAINWAAVTGILYVYNRVGTNTTSVYIRVKSAELWGKVAITGGGAGRPVTMADYVDLINASWGEFPVYCRKAGVGQVLNMFPVQIGDGVNKTNFSSSGISCEYPIAYSLSLESYQNTWNILTGGVSVSIKTGASDTISLASSIMQTQVEHDLTIDSTSSTSATYDFAGWSCIGFDPEWNSGITCNSAIFASCAEIDGKAATFSSCIFKQAKEIHALALDAGASVAGSSFTKGSDTYALKLRTAGTYTLNGATFTGYTTPIKITATTGTVTLALAAGQAEPAYSSDGATVVYEQPQQTITVLGLVTGSRVKISRVDTGEIIYTDVESSGQIVTPAITYNGLVEIEARNASGTPAYKPWVTRTTMSGSSVSLTATQEVD